MNRLVKVLVIAASFTMPQSWAVAETSDNSAAEYQHAGKQYPPVFFVTNIDDPAFKSKLESYNAFSRMDTMAVGLPIGVRVLKGRRTKDDSTRFSTLMLSASTLGLIPVVSNTEFKVRYEVFVQGKSIAKFEYQVDSTNVENMWMAKDAAGKTKPSEELFIEHTIPQFLNELRNSSEAQAAFQEYREYFGD